MRRDMHAADGVCVCVLLTDSVSFPCCFSLCLWLPNCIREAGALFPAPACTLRGGHRCAATCMLLQGCFQHLCVRCGGVIDAPQHACCRVCVFVCTYVAGGLQMLCNMHACCGGGVCLCVARRQCKLPPLCCLVIMVALLCMQQQEQQQQQQQQQRQRSWLRQEPPLRREAPLADNVSFPCCVSL